MRHFSHIPEPGMIDQLEKVYCMYVRLEQQNRKLRC